VPIMESKEIILLLTDLLVKSYGFSHEFIMGNTFNTGIILNDAPRAWGLYFQDSASPQMEAIVELHNNIMYFLFVILFGVGWILLSVVRNYIKNKSPISNKYLNHGTLIE